MQSRLVVLHRTDDDVWKFFKFVGNRCSLNGEKSLVVVGECGRSKNIAANSRHLPNGLQLRGKSCPLIVATKQFEPFIYYDDVEGFNKGIDYSIVRTISHRLRLKVNFTRTGYGSAVDSKTVE